MDTASRLHAIFLCFPIALFAGMLLLDVLFYFGKVKTLTLSHWLTIVGVITCIPAVITGLIVATYYDAGNQFLENHRYYGYATCVCSSLYAGIRISAMLWKLPIQPFHYVFLSLLLNALIALTADYGILLRL